MKLYLRLIEIMDIKIYMLSLVRGFLLLPFFSLHHKHCMNSLMRILSVSLFVIFSQNIRLNRIQVDLDLAKETPTNGKDKSTDSDSSKPPPTTPKKPAKLEQYDLSTSTDRLWREFKGAPFSDVAEAIREEVTTLRTYEKRMGELRSAMGLAGETGQVADSTLTLLDDNTARLTSAVRFVCLYKYICICMCM